MKITPLKKRCKERTQCCYECSVIFTYYHWMHTKAGWFLLKMHGTAWLSRKRLRGADAPSTPGRNVWSHFDWTFIFINIGRTNPIPIASTILLQNPLSKKELDFYQSIPTNKTQQFPTKKTTQNFGTLFCWTSLIRRSRQWVSATLELMLPVPWQLRSNPKGVGLFVMKVALPDFASTRSWRSKKILRWSCKRFSQIHFFGGMEDLYLSVAW